VHRNVIDFLTLSLSKGVKYLLTAIITIFLARNIGADGLGKWAMLMASGTLLHSIFLNWLQMPLVRFGCKEWNKKKSINHVYRARLPLLLIGMLLAILLVKFSPKDFLYTYFFITDEWKIFIIGYLLYLWFMVEAQSLMQIQVKFLQLSIFSVGIELLILLSISVVGYITYPLVDYLIISILILSYLFLWSITYIFQLRKMISSFKLPNIADIKQIVIYGWPLIPGFIAGYLSDWGDHLLLQYYYSSKQVGYLQPAYQFMLIIMNAIAPIGTILLPLLISAKNSELQVKKFLTYVTTISSFWAMLILPVIMVAPFLLGLALGDKFNESITLFTVLCISIPGAIFSVLYGVLFNVQGRNGRAMLYVFLMAIINLLTSYILISKIGVIGSAIGTSISYIFIQSAYILDQSLYLKSEYKSCFLLLVLLTIFGVIQAIMMEHYTGRLVFSICMFLIIAIIIRKYDLVSKEAVISLFQNRLYFIQSLLCRLFISQKIK